MSWTKDAAGIGEGASMLLLFQTFPKANLSAVYDCGIKVFSVGVIT